MKVRAAVSQQSLPVHCCLEKHTAPHVLSRISWAQLSAAKDCGLFPAAEHAALPTWQKYASVGLLLLLYVGIFAVGYVRVAWGRALHLQARMMLGITAAVCPRRFARRLQVRSKPTLPSAA